PRWYRALTPNCPASASTYTRAPIRAADPGASAISTIPAGMLTTKAPVWSHPRRRGFAGASRECVAAVTHQGYGTARPDPRIDSGHERTAGAPATPQAPAQTLRGRAAPVAGGAR